MRVLGNTREKHKFDAAFTYAKNKLTEFRTEERRKVFMGLKYYYIIMLILLWKVIGIHPYENAPYSDTQALLDYLLLSMQPPDDTNTNLYYNHLAILVS